MKTLMILKKFEILNFGLVKVVLHLKNITIYLDGYTLSGESKNLSEEKKVEVLKTLIKLVINASKIK